LGYVSIINFKGFKIRKKVLADLKNANYMKNEYDDELIADFFSYNENNEEIPMAFFGRLAYHDDTITVPESQRKYFDLLFEIVAELREKKNNPYLR
jgi:hypothetical protein